jgi:uncharacterized damage-inducible protein DinB
MLSRRARFCLILFVVGMAGVRTGAADCGYAELLRTHWSRTRRMITNIVAAMPEDKYDFRPVKEVRSFREMAVHLISDGISHMGWAAGMSREESEKISAKYENYKTRAEILQGLGEMFDYGDKILSEMTDESAKKMVIGMRSEPMTRFEAALVAFEDQTDHYGNMVVYLRINGIVPPSTANSAQDRQRNQELIRQQGLQP